MAFIQDPRLRQRWNQISHTTEAVTENAAAGIWTFQHRYITPCLSCAGRAVDACAAVCIGADREERARRARERDRGARRSRVAAEYTFDFYDDWAEDFADGIDDEGLEGAGGHHQGILGRIAGEDWDRLLAGTGGRRREEGEVVREQPGRKRGMSYGTRGAGGRRKVPAEEDPTIIPSTAPLGFLGRLPFRIGGTLRYKPSAANLKEHPGGTGTHEDLRVGTEGEPLLGESSDGEEGGFGMKTQPAPRQRSNTSGSGGTSDSYRSRNDLFPSDGEGDEDAVPLDDEFAVALDRVDDRGSNRTRSSKGKRVAGRSNSGLSLGLERTVSRTTISSTRTRDSGLKGRESLGDMRQVDGPAEQTMEELEREEEEVRRAEDEEVERKRRRAAQLAVERGLKREEDVAGGLDEVGSKEMLEVGGDDEYVAEPEDILDEQRAEDEDPADTTNESKTGPDAQRESSPGPDPNPDPDPGITVTPSHPTARDTEAPEPAAEFVPARLPRFR